MDYTKNWQDIDVCQQCNLQLRYPWWLLSCTKHVRLHPYGFWFFLFAPYFFIMDVFGIRGMFSKSPSISWSILSKEYIFSTKIKRVTPMVSILHSQPSSHRGNKTGRSSRESNTLLSTSDQKNISGKHWTLDMSSIGIYFYTPKHYKMIPNVKRNFFPTKMNSIYPL